MWAVNKKFIKKKAVLNFFTKFCVNTNMIKFTRLFWNRNITIIFIFIYILIPMI